MRGAADLGCPSLTATQIFQKSPVIQRHFVQPRLQRVLMLVSIQLERHVDLLRVHILRVEVLVDRLLSSIQRYGDEVRLISHALELPRQMVPCIRLHRAGRARRDPSCMSGVPYAPAAVGARVTG